MERKVWKKIAVIIFIVLIPLLLLTGCQNEGKVVSQGLSKSSSKKPIKEKQKIASSSAPINSSMKENENKKDNNKVVNESNEDQELIDLLNTLEEE